MTKVNTLSKLVLICGLATATFGATSVMAKGDMHKQGRHSQAHFLLSERGADKLDLTQEQQTKLEAIFAAQKTQMQALKGTTKNRAKHSVPLTKLKWKACYQLQRLTKMQQKSY